MLPSGSALPCEPPSKGDLCVDLFVVIRGFSSSNYLKNSTNQLGLFAVVIPDVLARGRTDWSVPHTCSAYEAQYTSDVF